MEKKNKSSFDSFVFYSFDPSSFDNLPPGCKQIIGSFCDVGDILKYRHLNKKTQEIVLKRKNLEEEKMKSL